jgi:mono/diheme cytochrome c family protein
LEVIESMALTFLAAEMGSPVSSRRSSSPAKPRPSRGCMAVLALLAAVGIERVQAAAGVDPRVRTLFTQHCGSCHDSGSKEGGIDVTSLAGDLAVEGRVWNRIHSVVASRVMPPAGEPPLSAEDHGHVLAWIEAKSKELAIRTAPRRLNRYEFSNTLNDLLGLQENFAARLPEDISVNGFDTNAEKLTSTGESLEQYLETIVTAVDWRFDSSQPGFAPIEVTVEEPPKKKPPAAKPVFRLPHPNQVNFKGNVPLIFRTENAVAIRPRTLKSNFGALNTVAAPFEFPAEFCATLPPSIDRFRLTLRVRSDAPANGSLPRLVVDVNNETVLDRQLEPQADFQDIVCHFRRSQFGQRDAFNIEIMNGYEIGDFFPDSVNRAIEVFGAQKPSKEEMQKHVQELLDQHPVLFIEKIILEPGRYADDAPPAHGLALTRLAELPDDDRRRALETFLSLAYRRPLEPSERSQFGQFLERQASLANSSQATIRSALAYALASPQFLYLRSTNPATPATDHQLAERLSYFFWSTTPDPALDAAARAGTLRSGSNLEGQVTRLLDHPNAERFFQRFAEQWLDTGKLQDRHESTDPSYRSGANAYFRSSLRREGGGFFQELVRSDRSALAIIDSDFVVVNDRLSTHYGLPLVRGGNFRAVSLPKDSPYGGMATLASVMTTTDHGMFRPIYRGHWVQKTLFNRPLPPPPTDVPELVPNDPRFKGKSLQQQLALHQEHAKCAVCHVRLDPLGYAFQEFDAIGRVVQGPAAKKLQTDGSLPNGERYANVREFRSIMLDRYRDDVIRGLISKLIAYGRGREPSLGERDWVERLLVRARQTDYRMRPLLLSIVESPEFLH